jgi:endoplasmic reticulum resident protein 44
MCVFTASVATRFHITKYPTLKIIRNGQPTKREYRGQRSAEAFLSFIQKQLADPIKEFTDLKELTELDVSIHYHFISLQLSCFST